MTNQRYNVFNPIHKGLRGMLYDTAIRLQQTDLSQPEAAPIIDQLEQILLFFDTHAEHEDRYILPHIRKHNAQLIDELEKDHEIDHRLTETLFTKIREWKAASSDENRESNGQRIFFAFSEFIAFNLYHMNKEENVLIYLLWKHYTDAEIRGMEEQILRAIPPQILLTESRWMMRSINDREIIEWLAGVKQGAPAEVFAGFLNLATEELPPQRMATIRSALELA